MGMGSPIDGLVGKLLEARLEVNFIRFQTKGRKWPEEHGKLD
jgi:hypothetical protein